MFKKFFFGNLGKFFSVCPASLIAPFLGRTDESDISNESFSVGGKDRSSSNSPIDFVESNQTNQRKIKTPKELRKPSKGEIELPVVPKKEPTEKVRKPNGQRGRPPNKSNKFMQDNNVKNAFDVFHKDQVNSHKNNHSQRNSQVSTKQIDDAWEKATEVKNIKSQNRKKKSKS